MYGKMKLEVLGPLLIIVCFVFHSTMSDIPVNCTFDDIRGAWTFYESARIYNSDVDCGSQVKWDPIYKKRISLEYPNVAIDDWGNKGTWTMVYNEGFEVRVSGRSYFSFSDYKLEDNIVTSFCNSTKSGWSRDATIRNWACFYGVKMEKASIKVHELLHPQNLDSLYKNNLDYIDYLNDAQNSWTAVAYPEYETRTIRDMYRRSGGHRLSMRIRPAKLSIKSRLRSTFLPDRFDWRNVSGVNFVSPVRDQLNCGSCYAFASMAGLESRIRIMTRNLQKPVFSPQDVIKCSHLSQGCDGGFAYLIAGRYAQEAGVLLEECDPYDLKALDDQTCSRNSSCVRHYISNYRYVGGYFGACNEEEMKLALIKGGPLMVGFEVYKDLVAYKEGIYRHISGSVEGGFNPLEITNHAVLLVGYGVDESTGEKFWSIKNSWGTDWGEDGFFRIIRGVDECAIESMAFEAIPIPA